MAETKQQTIIGLECNKQVGLLVTTDGDSVRLKFDTEGKITPSVYVPPSAKVAFDEIEFSRPEGSHERFRLAEHGYFSPNFDESVILTLHVTETKRGTFNVTVNAYRRNCPTTAKTDPQYLGSKVVQVGIKR